MSSTVTSQPVSQTGTMQPVDGGWMEAPVVFGDDPQHLGYLTLIDQVLIKQRIEHLEVVIGWETVNKYDILNSVGQRVYYAEEDTNCLIRNCCGPRRPFDIKIFDNLRVEVIHLYRPFRCCAWIFCCFCCLQELEVQSPPGQTIGYVHEVCDPCEGVGKIHNVRGNLIALETIQIRELDNTTQVGTITKQFGGLLREGLTDSDSFTVTFPLDLDVNMKAVAIGAAFLIDFMYFEEK
ncbi:phospholipid scramblase 1-like [Pomacea canaliculata]|uniref:phospholipid scramblase 1-like n=1 Tax=Pomacea canaliculata TaxID=400727 RepID=UPI000D72F590|nr:phospholipid scramblase 1-like [Pomacea canaliculata]